MFDRWYAGTLQEKLTRPYVHLVFGARQTGKSTLLQALLPPETLVVNLADPKERTRHLADPGTFLDLCRTLPADKKGQFVFVDEAQAVPTIFDAVQHLYDGDKMRWRFVLCGSSARKLRRIGSNLLPGRSFYHRLLPLTLVEHPANQPPIPYAVSPLPFPWGKGQARENPFPAEDLLTRLAYGDLPGVVAAPSADRAELLRSFAFVHLEEEIRREALVKDWGAFVRVMQLAAAESGQIVNFASISQESGVSQPTVKSYYQLLEDMFVGFRVNAFSRSPRKALLSTPKFLFFDLGVRHAAGGLVASPEVVKVNPAAFFEQWVGIELWKRLQWEAFCHSCKDKFGFHPMKDGPLRAAEMMGLRQGNWEQVWDRFREAPKRYPNLPGWLRKAKPQDDGLFLKESDEVWPQSNEIHETALRNVLKGCAGKTAQAVVERIKEMEAVHGKRRTCVRAEPLPSRHGCDELPLHCPKGRGALRPSRGGRHPHGRA